MRINGAPSVDERFTDAKQRYEAVIRQKGSWYDNWHNPDVYGDEATQESLLIARVLLTGIEDDLRQMPDTDAWLLHLAGVHWQGGLIDLLNLDFDRASTENSAMREIIPRVPKQLWGRHQQAQYESNAAFLDGEIALGRRDKGLAVAHFTKSLAIDLSIGDAAGAAR